jgi:hypothetical protein
MLVVRTFNNLHQFVSILQVKKVYTSDSSYYYYYLFIT